MSQKVVTTCDHCGALCAGDQYASIGRWEEPKTITFGKTIHGCSKEHLGLALAKVFGIDINWKMVDAIEAKNLEISDRDKRIAELETGFDYGILEATRNQRDLAEKRIAELTAPITIDGKTPGQVAYEAYVGKVSWHKDAPSFQALDEVAQVRSAWENSASTVLRAFSGDASITEQTKPTKPLLSERARDLLLRGAQTIEGLLGANPESTPERSFAYGLAGAMREHGANS